MRIGPNLFLDESLLEETFIRASGPGGQNVNKVNTAVQLRFCVAKAVTLPENVKTRLIRLAGRKMGADGYLTISAQRHRTQLQNRVDARARLAELIVRAAEPVKPRTSTKPTKGSIRRRLKAKALVGAKKAIRAAVKDESAWE